MIQVKQEIIELVEKSNAIKADLSKLFDVNMRSVERYLEKNDPLLTTASAIEIISTGLNKDKSEILAEA